VIYLGTRFSFARLKDLIERLAASMQGLGIKKNDKAIIYLPDCPQWLISWFGLTRLGAIPIAVTPLYTPAELIYIANDSEAETIICMDTNFGYVQSIIPETKIKRIIVTTLVELLTAWKRILGKVFSRVPKGKFTVGQETYQFKKLLTKSFSPLGPYSDLGIKGEDIVEILYTGGTTGLPKGTPFSNTNLMTSCFDVRSKRESVIPLGEDVIIQGSPLFHILGQAFGIGGMLVGDTCILLPRMDLDGVFDHIQRYKGTSFFGFPNIYGIILGHRRADYYDISSLKCCYSAGYVLPMEINNRWLEKYRVRISPGYGATETCGCVAITPADEEVPEGSAGKILPGKKVKLVDPDTLESLPEGEPGELLVSSNHMVTNYWNNPVESAKCFVKMDNRLWFRTKDIVRVDKNGWLYFINRSVDMIKHKGYRIAASEIETVLQKNPAVVSSCVVGIHEASLGERIKAFVVLKEGIKGVTGYDLIKWCRERLAPYKVPQYIEFRDTLPRSKVGKLLTREIRDDQKRRAEI
jgi:long-chain acyl-CoA synthetase